MRRKVAAMAMALCAIAGTTALSAATPATAQTGSGIGVCTTVSGTQNVGTVTVGQTFLLQLAPTCLFNPGTTLDVTANGVAFTKPAESTGLGLFTINVLSSTQMSINPVVPAICGVNTVTARGASSAAVGGIATQTATFTLTCPAVVPVAQGQLSRTGSDTMRYVAFALALVAVGSFALVATRRRRAAATR